MDDRTTSLLLYYFTTLLLYYFTTLLYLLPENPISVMYFEFFKITNIFATKGGPKSHLCIPKKGIARPRSQFPHSCKQFAYSQDRSSYFPAAKPFPGIFVSNFRYCVFAVRVPKTPFSKINTHRL